MQIWSFYANKESFESIFAIVKDKIVTIMKDTRDKDRDRHRQRQTQTDNNERDRGTDRQRQKQRHRIEIKERQRQRQRKTGLAKFIAKTKSIPILRGPICDF